MQNANFYVFFRLYRRKNDTFSRWLNMMIERNDKKHEICISIFSNSPGKRFGRADEILNSTADPGKHLRTGTDADCADDGHYQA